MRSRSQLLIVDDDTAMREMLASLFRDRGYAVEEAASAAEALERADQQCFDVALSDIRMPGKTGIEMVGELRERLPETPVVLMRPSEASTPRWNPCVPEHSTTSRSPSSRMPSF